MLKRMLAVIAAVTVIAVPVSSASAAAPSKNIVETAAGAPQFSTLVSLVKKAGLVGVLSGKTNYTVFAPTNAAFDKVPKKTLNQLASNKAMLKKVLLYHVLPGKVPASKVLKMDSAETAEGSKVTFEVRGKSAYVNDAKILKTDIRCSNGIVHAINAVLLPPSG
ncbi:MAG TPA: fasciclin domain-containing protein [Solirubrobacterales bacterium]|nr:fasciclin domain-containing protein [Solirubrobacterales bacterium]